MNHRLLNKHQLAGILSVETEDVSALLSRGQIPLAEFEIVKNTDSGSNREHRWSSYSIDLWIQAGMPHADDFERMKVEAMTGA